jgi:hypothetical protein
MSHNVLFFSVSYSLNHCFWTTFPFKFYIFILLIISSENIKIIDIFPFRIRISREILRPKRVLC